MDTNVFISGGTISLGSPSQVINHWRNQNFVMVVSPQLVAEYEEVLSRSRVMKYTGLSPQESSQYIQEVKDRAYMTSGTLELNVLTNDPDDNMVLACAEEGMATHLVTGNRKDFPFSEYKGIQISTPKEFLTLLKNPLRQEGIFSTNRHKSDLCSCSNSIHSSAADRALTF